MNILYMWKHSGIEDTVFGIIFTIVLLFEGRKGTCIVCRRMIGHCVCGQTACEWKRINCSYIHMYILIFIYYSLVLYTFKEFLCTVTRVREPLLVITVINHHNSRFFKHFVRISEPLKSAQKGFGDLFSVFFPLLVRT